MERVLKFDGAYDPKVFKFDRRFTSEGCGIAQGPRSGPGSEGSKGSEGKVSPSAMSMKSALRYFLLCLQCCLMKSHSPLPEAEISNTSEPGYCVSIVCTQSEHLKARPTGGTVRRRRNSVRSLLSSSVFPTAPRSSFLWKGPDCSSRDVLPEGSEKK